MAARSRTRCVTRVFYWCAMCPYRLSIKSAPKTEFDLCVCAAQDRYALEVRRRRVYAAVDKQFSQCSTTAGPASLTCVMRWRRDAHPDRCRQWCGLNPGCAGSAVRAFAPHAPSCGVPTRSATGPCKSGLVATTRHLVGPCTSCCPTSQSQQSVVQVPTKSTIFS